MAVGDATPAPSASSRTERSRPSSSGTVSTNCGIETTFASRAPARLRARRIVRKNSSIDSENVSALMGRTIATYWIGSYSLACYPFSSMQKRANSLGLDSDLLLISAVVVIGAIMSILDTTIVNVALETLGRDLHSSLDDVQWVSTGYLLALAVVIPLTGWTSERFGPRRVWLTSVTLFVLGSVLCGLAWNLESLIAFRVLQGLGGGMVMPVGMILLTQAAGPARVGRTMSIIGVPMLLGPVIGPVLGGLIVDNTSWRWIFFVNVPVGIVALVMGARWLPRVNASENPGRLDWRGLALLSLASG